MRQINEGNAIQVGAVIRGDDGSITVPTTLAYRVDDSSGASVIGWTSLTPESLTKISIPASSNVILDDSQPYENRMVTVMSDEGLPTQQVTAVEYRLKNLSSI